MPHGYSPESWAAKQAEVAEFSRRDPFQDEPRTTEKSVERLRQAYVIQCADVPDQFALVRRGDLGRILADYTRFKAVHEIWSKEREAKNTDTGREGE